MLQYILNFILQVIEEGANRCVVLELDRTSSQFPPAVSSTGRKVTVDSLTWKLRWLSEKSWLQFVTLLKALHAQTPSPLFVRYVQWLILRLDSVCPFALKHLFHSFIVCIVSPRSSSLIGLICWSVEWVVWFCEVFFDFCFSSLYPSWVAFCTDLVQYSEIRRYSHKVCPR